MSDFLTGLAYDHLTKNSEWLADAKTNAPLGERTTCGKYLTLRYGKSATHTEECVKIALGIIKKEER